MTRNLIPLLLLIALLITGCSVPVEINVDNEMRERGTVMVEKEGSEVNITLMEEPRILKVYEWGDWGKNTKYRNELALECRDELGMTLETTTIKLTSFHDRGTAEKHEGNTIIKHPVLDPEYIEDIITTVVLGTCRIRGFLDLRVTEYVDGILVENKTVPCQPWNYLVDGDEWIEMECQPHWGYDETGEYRCEPNSGVWNTNQLLTNSVQAQLELTERCFT